MEAAGAKIIFERLSVERTARYTEYYGDGDSKAYSEVRNIWGQRSSQIWKCWPLSKWALVFAN